MYDAADVQFDGCTFINMDTFTFLSSAQVTDSVFLQCKQIDSGGGVFTGTGVLSSTVATAASAFVWDSATDPDGYMDNMIFSKGSNSHHAIEFGTSAPTSITLRGVTFSGFNGSDGQDDSVLYLADKGSDQTWTIGCVGCTGTVTYKKARSGDTVTITQGVSLTVHVQDADTGSSIEGATVLAKAASGGPYPYQESVGITRSSSTCTVAHTGHGMDTDDWVLIEGCTEGDYNGVWQITYIGVDSYSFDIGSKTPSSPATGSPTSTFAMIVGTTNSSGNATDTRTYSGDQPFTGRVRKASSSPYYKTGPFSGTIDSATGAYVTVQMVEET
jgi:hypothetical protein